jgi:hypothetical protein
MQFLAELAALCGGGRESEIIIAIEEPDLYAELPDHVADGRRFIDLNARGASREDASDGHAGRGGLIGKDRSFEPAKVIGGEDLQAARRFVTGVVAGLECEAELGGAGEVRNVDEAGPSLVSSRA